MNRIAWLVVLFACGDKKSEPPAAKIEPLGLVLTESGLGPIGASTSAKAEAFQARVTKIVTVAVDARSCVRRR